MDSNEKIKQDYEEKYKDAYRDYLADDSQFKWKRWDKLRQVMFAMGKSLDEVTALMDEVEAKVEAKPSTFSKIFPAASIFHKHETEVIALNIMVILSRTGDKFRDISLGEYIKERKKDGSYTTGENKHFFYARSSCTSEYKAREFSKFWKEA